MKATLATVLACGLAKAAFGAYGGTTELGDLHGQGGWVLSAKKGGEAPSSPQVVTPGLDGSGRAALFHMIGYNNSSNDSAQRDFTPVSGTMITVEITVKPSSTSRCISVAVRSGNNGAAYIRFNGRKSGWCQHYDDTDTYRDIAPYNVDAENRLKIELNTSTRKLKAWVNGVGGDEWNFHRSVSSVNRIDLFMTHGNGPEVWSIVDDIMVRDDGGTVVFSEDFESYYAGSPSNRAPSVDAGSDRTVTLPDAAGLDGTVSDDGLPGGALTVTWSKVSGLGEVTFGNAHSVDTTAFFAEAGTYVLRLRANDGELTARDEVTVTVNAAPAADSDGDGLPDDWETRHFGNLDLGPDDDPDQDGLANSGEYDHGTDPNDADTDGDGLGDAVEASSQTSPTDPDSDDDGLSDGDEVLYQTDPVSADTDGDDMPDGWEVRYRLDPKEDDASEDADGDGFSNYDEYVCGSDPSDASSVPSLTFGGGLISCAAAQSGGGTAAAFVLFYVCLVLARRRMCRAPCRLMEGAATTPPKPDRRVGRLWEKELVR